MKPNINKMKQLVMDYTTALMEVNCKEALISETWFLHTRSTMTAPKIDRNLSNIALIRLLLPEQLWAIEAS